MNFSWQFSTIFLPEVTNNFIKNRLITKSRELSLWVHRLQPLFQAGSVSRPIGPGLSRQPPSAGQAPLAVLRDRCWSSVVTWLY